MDSYFISFEFRRISEKEKGKEQKNDFLYTPKPWAESPLTTSLARAAASSPQRPSKPQPSLVSLMGRTRMSSSSSPKSRAPVVETAVIGVFNPRFKTAFPPLFAPTKPPTPPVSYPSFSSSFCAPRPPCLLAGARDVRRCFL